MHALFGTGWTQHLVIQGSCLKDVCAIFDLLLGVFFLFTIDKHVCVKDSSAKGTCSMIKEGADRNCSLFRDTDRSNNLEITFQSLNYVYRG